MHIEFSSKEEQDLWNEDRLAILLLRTISENSWNDKDRKPVPVPRSDISAVFKQDTHPDYGPVTAISFSHGGISLQFTQLKAYRSWFYAVSQKVATEISRTLHALGMSKTVVCKCSVDYSFRCGKSPYSETVIFT